MNGRRRSRVRSGSGRRLVCDTNMETRKVYVALGIERHERDLFHWLRRDETGTETLLRYLKSEFESSGVSGYFRINEDVLKEGLPFKAICVNREQQVRYDIEIIYKKHEFKTALETRDAIVIYNGHSRYGRGACFGVYRQERTRRGLEWQRGYFESQKYGNQWENGNNNQDGLFRMGYPYFLLELKDPKNHRYQYSPVAHDERIPRRGSRGRRRNFHSNARGRMQNLRLPDDPGFLRRNVISTFADTGHRYKGKRGADEDHSQVLIRAGWRNTYRPSWYRRDEDNYDLGATTLNCRVFCHFGCSSRLHYLRILTQFRGYRERRPNNRFLYLTSATSDQRDVLYYMRHMLTYQTQNNHENLWTCLAHAQNETNRTLREDRARNSRLLNYRIVSPQIYNLRGRRFRREERRMLRRIENRRCD